jgi:hypothetical protein
MNSAGPPSPASAGSACEARIFGGRAPRRRFSLAGAIGTPDNPPSRHHGDAPRPYGRLHRFLHPDPCRQAAFRAGWVHEIKHDGYRLIVGCDGKVVRLFTRRGRDWTGRYPAIAGAATKLRAKSFTLDGEAVVTGEDGIAMFGAVVFRQPASSGLRASCRSGSARPTVPGRRGTAASKAGKPRLSWRRRVWGGNWRFGIGLRGALNGRSTSVSGRHGRRPWLPPWATAEATVDRLISARRNRKPLQCRA